MALVAMAAAVLASPALAADPLPAPRAQEIFERGNSAYESGDFTAAAQAYRELVAGGWESAVVDYNLGNALYRMGRTGEAILAYERARRHAPGNREIRENLEFVSERIVDRVDTLELDAGPLATLSDWHARISASAATLIFLACWTLFNVCLGAAWMGRGALRRMATYALATTVAGVLLAGILLGGLIYRRDTLASGVILEDRVDLLSVPGGGVRVTTVHEGLKVRVEVTRDDWVEVRLPNGFQGWLPRSAVGLV